MNQPPNPHGTWKLLPSIFKDAFVPGVGRRQTADRLTRWLITSGGMLIILAILAIFFVILAVVYPLFKSPRLIPEDGFSLAGRESAFLAVGADEYRQIAYAVSGAGIHFYSIKDKGALPSPQLPALQGARIVAVAGGGRDFLALGLSDGRVLPVRVRFHVTFPDGKRRVDADLETRKPVTIDAEGKPVSRLAVAAGEDGFRIAAAGDSGTIALVVRRQHRTLMGTVRTKEFRKDFPTPAKGAITALAMHADRNDLFIGTASGQILHAAGLDGRQDEAVQVDVLGATPRETIGVSVLGFLAGGQTLVVGDESGQVKSYQVFERQDGRFKMVEVHSFKAHDGPVTLFAASRRDRGFFTGDRGGALYYRFGTTGKTSLTLPRSGEHGLSAVALTAKGDGLLALDTAGRLFRWSLVNPHPEISWAALFGELWYEGYPQPEYVWQSTGGTDEFEPKFSLTPLVFGTLKGTIYAMLFAVPLAVFGAFYTSQFMRPFYKDFVKPVVEIMAALPSVVLGFIAALWLAPRVETWLPGLVIAPFVIVVLVFLFVLAKDRYPRLLPGAWKMGSEIFVLIGLAILGCGIGFYLGAAAETWFFNGDYKPWLNKALGLSYDQRNSLVVGIAMGFAVIPIIFTIAEDSLSNVPGHLRAGSLALGATQWQTAINVILPTASPGIFSAIMIGFGRAVGETMIVLMATGNTPIMDMNIFSGFRALAANIAVELPEAPEGGTLFRILFLAALLLFMLTFFINSLAEWVRLRLREKYRLL
ncbi:MAG: ABC transporter permease subunit [Nitrospinales bacterium]